MGKPCRKLPGDIHIIIIKLCSDYRRRAAELSNGVNDFTVRREYSRLNCVIDEAVGAIVGNDEYLRRNMIGFIADSVSYDRAGPIYMSAKTYKKTKRSVKYEIARRLNLVI